MYSQTFYIALVYSIKIIKDIIVLIFVYYNFYQLFSVARYDRSNTDADSHLFDGDISIFKTLFFIAPIYILMPIDREISSLLISCNIEIGVIDNSVLQIYIYIYIYIERERERERERDSIIDC